MGFLVSDNGRVGFDDNFVSIAVVDYCALLTPGVKLQVISVMQRSTIELVRLSTWMTRPSVVFEPSVWRSERERGVRVSD